MKRTIAALAIGLAIAAPAGAQNLYAVGGLGMSRTEIDKAGIDADIAAIVGAPVSSSVDTSGTSWRAGIGYQAHRNIAIEGGWVDLGKSTYTATAPGVTAGATFKAAGPYAAVLLQAHPASYLTGFLKVGISYPKVRAEATATGPGGSASASASSTSLAPTYGAGLMLNLTKTVGVRLEAERFHKVGGTDTGEANVDVATMSLQVRF